MSDLEWMLLNFVAASCLLAFVVLLIGRVFRPMENQDDYRNRE